MNKRYRKVYVCISSPCSNEVDGDETCFYCSSSSYNSIIVKRMRKEEKRKKRQHSNEINGADQVKCLS